MAELLLLKKWPLYVKNEKRCSPIQLAKDRVTVTRFKCSAKTPLRRRFPATHGGGRKNNYGAESNMRTASHSDR